MKIESTEEVLKKFDYSYHLKNDEIIIDMELSHKILVDFSNPQKVIITDKLIGYNFLTGIFKMSIKKAILFNIVIGFFLSLLISLENANLGVLFFIALMVWVLLWSFFYISKSETLKQILINWND
ncbi:hypothetical protein [Flavicella sediminum]|uniref:hypothetical protein n=1 Tax=Flavicella sediminum TaxID=2585141 RepID=UPI00111F42D7|nr:hypothetical protein [Flavicella sediminum]